MQLLGISGSLRRHSYNTALLHNFKNLAPSDIDLRVYDQLHLMPPFNEDTQTDPNQTLQQFQRRVQQSDAIIISTPEYAHGLPGALKNALDWLVSYEGIVLKPIALMSVSTSGLGGYRAHAALVAILNAMNTRLIIDASIHVPFAKAKFNDEGKVTDDILLDRMNNSMNIIHRAVLQT